MALMTPRGLKVRVELPYAFGLLARLWSEDDATDAFRVLRTCEAIETVPKMLAILAAIGVAGGTAWPPWTIAAAYAGGITVGKLLTHGGLYIVLRPTGLLRLAYVFNFMSGFGLLLLTGLATTWWLRGWQGPMWWIVGTAIAYGVEIIFEGALAARNTRVLGHPLTSSEANFFNAYRLHADRVGLSNDLSVTEEELQSRIWRDCLLDYATKYPQCVARFPNKYQVLDAIGTEWTH